MATFLAYFHKQDACGHVIHIHVQNKGWGNYFVYHKSVEILLFIIYHPFCEEEGKSKVVSWRNDIGSRH